MIDCPLCGGNGAACDQCEGGRLRITQCPKREVLTAYPGIGTFVDMVNLFDQGAMPVSGGVLDQCDSFLVARQYLQAQEAKMKDDGDGRPEC